MDEPLSSQIAFDTALNGIRNQGGPASNEDRTCVYRASNGNRCGIGHLIDDADYHLMMEGETAVGILRDFRHLPSVERLAVLEDDFLLALQAAHDDSVDADTDGGAFMTCYEDRMATVARDYELTYAPPSAT